MAQKKMTQAQREAAIERIRAEGRAKQEAARERMRRLSPSQRYEAGGAMRETARAERVDIFNPLSEESVYRRQERSRGAAASERSGVEYARTGRVARSQSFPQREESGRVKEAIRVLKQRGGEGYEPSDEEIEYELMKTDKPSRFAEERPKPFFKDSMIKRERAEVVSREAMKTYECECGKIIDRDQTPTCLCKVRSGDLFERGVKGRKQQRRSKDRAAAGEVKVRAHNATEAALKAKLAVAQPDVRGRGGREALLTEGRAMERVEQRSAASILREQFEKTALRADALERKLNEEGGKLNLSQRDALRRDIAKLRRKANDLRDMADSQKRYGSESQAFKLGGMGDNTGWMAAGLIAIGAFALYRMFQRTPTAA
jgi:hypothetical protein